MTGKSHLIHLIILCEDTIGLVDKRRAAGVDYLNLSKAFDALSHDVSQNHSHRGWRGLLETC